MRHILKARIFALVVDIDSYEAGFEKLTTVFDEIIMYIQQRFVGSTEFGEAITSIELHLQTEDDGSLLLHCIAPVSYTHLDVYKRQGQRFVFIRHSRVEDIDERLILVHSSHPWEEKQKQISSCRTTCLCTESIYETKSISSYAKKVIGLSLIHI